MPRERELKKWDGGMDMSLDDMALESTGKHGTTGWDQFAVNEQNFGARTTYNEDDYTTSIDRSKPEYKRLAAEADRIAREIEGTAPANSHVLEERHQNANNDDGMDEEEKYSGVRRESAMAPLSKGGAGSYVPPSRRPITSQPTISGAPFDPAIISLSKPVPAPAAQPTAVPEKAPEPEVPTEASAKTDSTQATGSENVNKPTTAPAVSQPKKTTEDHLRGTADAFKQFANNEKLRLRAAQEAKRTNARHEKNVKLNDLKKFAENFRLKSRVPDDLVPILAKDHDKQLEIKRKAEESARFDEEKRKDHEKEGTAPTPTKSAPSQATTPSDARAHAQQTQSQTRNRVSQNLRGGMQMSSPRAPLQQRHNLPFMNQARGGVPPPQPLPTDLRIPSGPTSAREVELLSPTAANNARLNVNAKEFKFTPGASSFTPTGASPSPQRMPVAPPVEAPIASFFDATEKKSSDVKKDVNTHCDTLRRMREAEYPAEWKKGISENGGIPHSFRTPPTWTVPTERQNIKYLSTFPEPRSHSQGPSPMHTPNPATGATMPHAHQLPAHLQAPHLPNPGHQQRFPNMAQYGVQHGHAQNFDPRMQFPGGPGNSVQNSPRYAPAQMAGGYNGQMGQMPMPQFAGQPMQGYGMSPSMGYRQMQGPGGPMMMQPNQPHPQMNQMRPNYPPGGPGYGPNMPQMGGGAPMMAQNPSSSGFMPPQNQGYSPMPPQAQPQMPHMPQQSAGPNGYAGSPRPGPHMMAHSGSHQGFAPHMQQQHSQHGPQFAPPFHGQQQPHQGQRHPSNGGFVQMTPRSQQAMPSAQQSQGHVPSPGMSGQAPAHGDERK
jgi:hypothetical protein